MNKQDSIEKIAAKWGLLIFLMLSSYFIIMKAVGLVHVVELRILNAAFMFFGCFKAIQAAKKHIDETSYFQGIGVGALSALIATLLFSLFGLVYINYIDPSFVNSIIKNEPFGLYIGGYGAIIQIFIEGTTSGFMMSYVIMQWEKAPHSMSH